MPWIESDGRQGNDGLGCRWIVGLTATRMDDEAYLKDGILTKRRTQLRLA